MISFNQFQHLIQDEKPLFLRGKVRRNGPEEAPSVIVEEAYEITSLRKKLTRGILVRLFDTEEIHPTISQVERICGRYRGNCTTFVSVETAQGASRKYRLPEQFMVDPNDDLVREFGEAFGSNRILFTR